MHISKGEPILVKAETIPQESLHDYVVAICTHDYPNLRIVVAGLFAETTFFGRVIYTLLTAEPENPLG